MQLFCSEDPPKSLNPALENAKIHVPCPLFFATLWVPAQEDHTNEQGQVKY